jgi:hypothetical protein
LFVKPGLYSFAMVKELAGIPALRNALNWRYQGSCKRREA